MTITSNRKFGVEIEFCTTLTRDEIADRLTDAGINVQAEGYNHYTRPHWKVISDASVARGWELVSPVLSGPDAVAEVQTVVNALVEAGCTVDTSCGLHVHVDARDLTGATIANVVRRYANHEATIDKMVPMHRRNNGFAGTMATVVPSVERAIRNNALATAGTVCAAVSDRYKKLNLCSFLKHGTLEFRQHSGSIDGTKIANWIQFCVQFVEDSIVQVRTVTPAPVQAPVAAVVAPTVTRTENERINALSRRYRKLIELFMAAGSYRTIEVGTIALALEISESSVPTYISMCRSAYPRVVIKASRGRGYFVETSSYTLREVLDGTVVAPVTPVYAPVVAPVAPVTTVVIPEDRGPTANLPVRVRAFYQERAMDFETNAR